MTREDNPYLNKTYVYTYDNAGNRTSRKTYAYTTGTLGTVISTENYQYDGDRLTRVGSMQYTYDTIGNLTSYNGYSLDWEGRNLVGISMDNGYTFEYNADGIRTQKTHGNAVYLYGLNGSQIVTETKLTRNVDGTETFVYLLVYLYDENGMPIGFQYRDTNSLAYQFDTYYFEKNLQGDIIAVYTEGGTKIGSYTYDAWGVCSYSYASGATSAQKQIVSTLNPFRYRGYYYDTETGFYYLQTRYYNPQRGRFLNADGQMKTGINLIGINLFAYCNNNPIKMVDPNGKDAIFYVDEDTLPIVGHAVRLFQDSNDNWYKTQLCGDSFQIVIGVITSCMALLCSILQHNPLPLLNVGCALGTIEKEFVVEHGKPGDRDVEFYKNQSTSIYLSGDYSYLSEKAENKTVLYSLLFNNCATYVNKLLKEAPDETVVKVAKRNHIIPMRQYKHFKECIS